MAAEVKIRIEAFDDAHESSLCVVALCKYFTVYRNISAPIAKLFNV